MTDSPDTPTPKRKITGLCSVDASGRHWPIQGTVVDTYAGGVAVDNANGTLHCVSGRKFTDGLVVACACSDRPTAEAT